MDVKLKVLAGKHAGKEIPLTKSKFLIGRADDCHLRAGSDLISRHHCMFVIGEDAVVLKDFGSRNGTLVNDQRVEGERRLQAGDQLKIGPLEFKVVIAKPAAAQKPAAAVKKNAAAAAAKTEAGHSVEDSICEWLGEPDPNAATRSMSETRSIKIGNTDYIKLKEAAQETAEKEAAEAEGAETEKAEEGAKSKKKKEPGKLPPVPKQAAKDSREAAANIWRDMAKRR
jgi:pSer/pThr/pTyr-binding forkhead associated (FHA) protein